MSRNACLALAAFAVFALAACSRAPMPPDTVATQSATAAKPAPGEMLAQLIALDQQAVARAEHARNHGSLDAPARELVETIYMHHRRNLTQTRALGDAEALDVADTRAIRDQRAEAAKQVEALGEVDADTYPDAFLNAVIDSSQRALELIDGYMDSTDNADIRKHLERTRDNFTDDIEAAKGLQTG